MRAISLDGIVPAGAAAVVVNAVIVDPDGAGGELALFGNGLIGNGLIGRLVRRYQ